MPSARAHRGEASHQGRSAAQRELSRRGGIDGDEGGDPLERHLIALAEHARRTKYDISVGRCFWCGGYNCRTGSLKHVGPVLFCPACKNTYRTLKDGKLYDATETDAEAMLKVHMADAWGKSHCGIGTRVTQNPKNVTCLRCQKYQDHRVPMAVLKWLEKLAK